MEEVCKPARKILMLTIPSRLRHMIIRLMIEKKKNKDTQTLKPVKLSPGTIMRQSVQK